MKKQILCVLAVLCVCLFCTALSESAEAPAPFSFRGMCWDMCPDEVMANESIDLTEMELESTATYGLKGSDASLAGYDASLCYLFYSRSLYAAIEAEFIV